jgi:NADH:ubiquinone oxidoreductase subunit K
MGWVCRSNHCLFSLGAMFQLGVLKASTHKNIVIIIITNENLMEASREIFLVLHTA